VTSADAARAGPDRTPIVLAGSVVAGSTPVAEHTRAAVEERWPGCVRVAGDAARAAAWLAAVRSGLPATLHRDMVSLPG
jgi:hypothetical protein